jgi:branched-chain amino acid transport system permease protein
MDLQIALLLGQDGVVNGAIYALLALTLVLVFSVTRVIFVPQGELVAFGALTLAAMQMGTTPPTAWLAVVLGALALAAEGWRAARGHAVEWRGTLVWCVVLPLVALGWTLFARPSGLAGQVVLTLLICTPLGPLLVRGLNAFARGAARRSANAC